MQGAARCPESFLAHVHTERKACNEAPAQLFQQVLCEHARFAQHPLHHCVLSAVVAWRCALASTVCGCVLLLGWMCVCCYLVACVYVADRLNMCEPTEACGIPNTICCLLVAREGSATPAEGCVGGSAGVHACSTVNALEITATQRDRLTPELSRMVGGKALPLCTAHISTTHRRLVLFAHAGLTRTQLPALAAAAGLLVGGVSCT